jgi:hypothetical protein
MEVQMYEVVRDLINKTGNRIFGVTFTKKNGEIRKMTARLHVRHPKHSPAPFGYNDRAEQDRRTETVTVYDMNKVIGHTQDGKPLKGAYRCFKAANVKELKVNGEVYRF